MKDTKKEYKVKSNDFEFTFSNEQIDSFNMTQRSPSTFHIIKDNRSVNAKVIEADINTKQMTIEVEGEQFQIEINEELDQILEKMGFGIAQNKLIKEIKAPMPGLVLEISVVEGQEVLEGDKILILVAMKMENSIVIHSNATIKRIAVVTGQAVEKGQLLVELE